MGSRRFILASLAAATLLGATAAPTDAKRPAPDTSEERPLTPQEQAASDRKADSAERYVETVDSSDYNLVSLACVTPTSAEATTVDEATTSADGTGLEPTVVPLGCFVPQDFIAVEARDQLFGHYCGPAVGQVIGNYSWAMGAGANRYTQQRIAGWMSTDVNGQTGAFSLELGLEKATAGSPRRPAGWDWIVTNLTDSDRDGWFGDQMHAYARSNISGARMPLAIPVKPHDANSPSDSNLASWPNPVKSVGHWVAIYGWVGTYDGTDSARMYFTDSSRDEGGATGKFWTPTRRFAFLILEHTGRFVW